MLCVAHSGSLLLHLNEVLFLCCCIMMTYYTTVTTILGKCALYWPKHLLCSLKVIREFVFLYDTLAATLTPHWILIFSGASRTIMFMQ